MPRKKKTETEENKEEKIEKPAEAKEKIKKKVVKEEKKTEDTGEKSLEKSDTNKDEKETKSEKGKIMGKDDGKTLIPLEDYVKSGIYIGTKVITPNMRQYVYRRRNDGIAIINTTTIDQKIKEAAKFLADFSPEDFIIVCKREGGWKAVDLFSKLTGVRVFTKKYPAGILTNTKLPNFFETELIFICDPWLDKNALKDAQIVKKPVLGLCDTNNLTNGVEVVVPCNNKSNKSLGVIFYILAREYMKARGIKEKLPAMEEFIGEELGELQVKKKPDKKKESELERARAKIESIRELNEEKEE